VCASMAAWPLAAQSVAKRPSEAPLADASVSEDSLLWTRVIDYIMRYDAIRSSDDTERLAWVFVTDVPASQREKLLRDLTRRLNARPRRPDDLWYRRLYIGAARASGDTVLVPYNVSTNRECTPGGQIVSHSASSTIRFTRAARTGAWSDGEERGVMVGDTAGCVTSYSGVAALKAHAPAPTDWGKPE
jgi:hypothetical protein